MKRLILIFVLFLVGCNLQRKVLKTDNTETTTITERKNIFRKGDSLSIVIPKIVYKDTIIQKVNYETKTVARVVYDKKGNSRVDCISAEIKQELETIKQNIKNDVQTQNRTKSGFNPQYLFYAISVMIIVLIIGLFSVNYLLSKWEKQILEIIKNK